MAHSNRNRGGLGIGLALAVLASTSAGAAIHRVVDRQFPVAAYCPFDLNGWRDGGLPVDLSFIAPSSSVRITLSAPSYHNGSFVSTHIDNVAVVLRAEFPDNPANLHDPLPNGPYYDCYAPPGTEHAPSFLFTNFSWPGPAGPLLSLFDADEECWTGDVYFDPLFRAPRDPGNETDTTGGSLGIGKIQMLEPDIAAASRIVTGLVPGQEYLVFAWWHADQADTPLTLTIDGAACLDNDADGFVDCSGCAPCELQAGQTCGDCDDANAAIRPVAADAACDGIDQNCSGQADEGFPGGCQCAGRTSGIVGWWPGDLNATDRIGQSHGTLVPNTWVGPGLVGDAFYFDLVSGSGVVLPDDDDLEFTSQMTIETWISALELSESTRPIISKLVLNGNENAYAIYVEPSGGTPPNYVGRLEASVSSDGTTTDGLASPTGLIHTSPWTHVAMTFDSGLLRLYVNGEMVASKVSTVTSIYDQGTINTNIGRDPSGSVEFVGYIDEPAMYDRALSPAEIRAIYDAGAQGMCPCGASPFTTFYRDADLDGFGDAAVSVEACAAPAGHVAISGDCDDTDPGVRPGLADATCDGIDDDCDGSVDDGFPGGCQCTIPAPGLVSWWPGEGSANDVRGTNHGTLTGGAYSVGQVGQAFSLDGIDDHVGNIGSLGTFSFLQNTALFTIAAWINLTDLNALTEQAITANTATTIEKGHFFIWDNAAGQKRLRLAVLNGINNTYVMNSSSVPNIITTAGWHHVAATANGTSITFFVDGVGSPGSGTLGAFSSGDSTRTLSIGRCPYTTPACQLAGRVDEVQIFNRPLGASEVRALFEAGSVALCRCTDADLDGYGAAGGLTCSAGTQQDCNDNLSSTHPGAPELCNGVDDDCDGTLDDGLAQSTFYRDVDGDGYGVAAPTIQACAPPAGYAANSADCNDANVSISPGAADATCDGVDQNCSGVPDENFLSPPDGWIATPLAGAPSARRLHTMVSTGDSVIVWGGLSGSNDGGVYRPRDAATDAWTPTQQTNAPSTRFYHTAVWTGTEMVVWGGSGGGNTGGFYNPTTDTWGATTTTGAPTGPRVQHSAVWTGTHMIIWGGSPINTGAAWQPGPFGGSWTALPSGAPAARSGHTAIWSGNYMVVWGGFSGSTQLATGGRFSPSGNAWLPMSASPLAGRSRHTAVWTGSKMIIWGGYNGVTFLNDGALYDPESDVWTPVAAGPPGRYGHTAVWDATNGLMVIWGGFGAGPWKNDGWTYDPFANTWTALTTTGAPTERYEHTAAWLSATQEMVVWGGNRGSVTNTGGRIVVDPFDCGVGGCLQPSRYSCTAGQLGYGCTPGTPTTEVCNGVDDDCDSTTDEGIPAPAGRPNVLAGKFSTEEVVQWSPVAGATGYDVVRGGLSALRSSGGDFTTSMTDCLAEDTPDLFVSDGSLPGPGDGVWQLVRAVNSCGGNGSYDTGSASQQGSRNAEIAASPLACP